MKVIEKDTDRRAEVHLYAQGNVDALDEYGEYVDPVDNAICCFVPVEADQRIKLEGKFHGTTIAVHYDVIIDGICRKAFSYTSKAVTFQKNKKLGSDQYLYKTDDGVIDSALIVWDYPQDLDADLDENAPSNIGTVEMRVYVLRRFGDQHLPRGPVYYDCENEGYDTHELVGYKSIKPEFALTFDEDSPVLETRKANAHKRYMNAPRPGTEPWAIFRFHYRRLDQIDDLELSQSFGVGLRQKTAPHTLDIEVLPKLEPGSKPAKSGDGEDESTRQSSIAPSVSESAPNTPLAKTTVRPSIELPGPTQSSTEQPLPNPAMPPKAVPGARVKLTKARLTPEDFARLNRTFTNPSAKPTHMEKEKTKENGNGINGDTGDSSLPRDGTNVTNGGTATEVAVMVPPTVTGRGSNLGSTTPNPLNLAPTTLTKPPAGATLPKEPVPPAKRSDRTDITPPNSPPTKRTKLSPLPASPSPVTAAGISLIERKHRELAELKKKREQTSTKHQDIKGQLAPYLAEELAQLERQIAEEQKAAEEEEKEFLADAELLKKFESGSG